MPKRSSKRPPSDPVDSAFATLQHVIDLAESDPQDEVMHLKARIAMLQRLCGEVRDFVQVGGGLPPRVVDALDNAAHGRPLTVLTLLPITPEDFPAEESPAVSLGRLGGLKGGDARAKALSAKKRREIARRGAAARWGKRR